MTENEVIEDIKENILPCVGGKSLVVAINALEKQIPKKPENKKYSFYPHSNLLKSKYGECPVCKTIQADDEYCANCGQKLDWSEEE